MDTKLSEAERIALETYTITIAPNREHPKGKSNRGNTIHWMGRGPALFLPLLFAGIWGWALIYALGRLH
jgi:hypothetical protein